MATYLEALNILKVCFTLHMYSLRHVLGLVARFREPHLIIIQRQTAIILWSPLIQCTFPACVVQMKAT